MATVYRSGDYDRMHELEGASKRGDKSCRGIVAIALIIGVGLSAAAIGFLTMILR